MKPIFNNNMIVSSAILFHYNVTQRSKLYCKGIKIFAISFLILAIWVQPSCKKFVEAETPPNKVTQSNIYLSDPTATSVLTGIYISVGTKLADLAKYGGLLADEWTPWTGINPDTKAYYVNFLQASESINWGGEIWNSYYNIIFKCNAALEGISGSNSLSSHVKTQLLGESYFMRAWLNFYLVNLYGELPLPTSTDPETNRLLPRSSLQSVYQLIIGDLLKAQELLSSEYVNGQLIAYTGIAERVRPTRWAATAMLARVYLYQDQYTKAETEASKTIDQTKLFSLLPLLDIFVKNSREAILQLQPSSIGWNTPEARTFHLAAPPSGLGTNKPVHLSSFLLEAFETGDQRKVNWIDSLKTGNVTYYYPVKYKIGAQNTTVTSPASLTEYSMVLRLSEQYLIRAEARAKQNNLPGAISDLDSLRKRAGLPLIADTDPNISQASLLNLILHERQTELFTETGHRWLDLKRTGKVNEVMNVVTPLKGGNWEDNYQLLPIPYTELLLNPKLTQNPGY